MLIKQVMEVFDVLDSSTVDGAAVKKYLQSVNPEANVEVYPLEGPKGSTDMVKVRIPGTNGKSKGGSAPTIGLLGRLGGIGARPEMIGLRIRWRRRALRSGCSSQASGYADQGRLPGRRRICLHTDLPPRSDCSPQAGSLHGLPGGDVPGQ